MSARTIGLFIGAGVMAVGWGVSVAAADTPPPPPEPAAVAADPGLAITSSDGAAVTPGETFVQLPRSANGACDASGGQLDLSFERTDGQLNKGTAKIWIDDQCRASVQLLGPDASVPSGPDSNLTTRAPSEAGS